MPDLQASAPRERSLSRYWLYRWLSPPRLHTKYLQHAYAVAGGLVGETYPAFDFRSASRVLLCGAGRASTVQTFYGHVRRVSPAARLTLLDLRPELFTRTCKMLGPDSALECCAGDALAMPFGDATFDWIETDLFFQFIAPEDLPRLTAEWRRVLKPGGLVTTRFFSVEDAADAPWFIRRWRFISWLLNAPCHRHPSAEIEAAFRAAGFAVTMRALPKVPAMRIRSLVAVKD